MTVCECGCGGQPAAGNRFILGHSGGHGPYKASRDAAYKKRDDLRREAETRLGREIVQGECCCGCGQPTKPATKTSAMYGWIIGKPTLYLHGHGSRGRKLNQAPDYVVDENGCWIWQKARKSTGYGHLGVAGRSVPAHQHYYEQSIGRVPKGRELHHLCGVKLCVNPEHLEPLTRAEHMRQDGRMARSSERFRTLNESPRGVADAA